MTICFIYTTDTGTIDHPLSAHCLLPLGFASVITCVLNAGNKVELLVFHNQCSYEEIFCQIKKVYDQKGVLLFSFTAVSSQMPFVLKIATIVREIAPHAKILLGGSHPTLNPEVCVSYDVIDMICIGEGEYAVPELIERLRGENSLIGVNNIWFKNLSGVIIHNPLNQWIENLDNIPFIDREIWRPWIEDFFFLPSILIGRGCVNRCAFCSNHAIRKVTTGKYVRYRSAENIVQEVIQLKKTYPTIHNIYFEIETIALNIDNIFLLCDKLSFFNSSIDVPVEYKINLSPNELIFKNRDKIVEKFLAANIKLINIGLESGSERIRNEVLFRPKHSNEEFINFCLYLQNNGIEIHLNVMVGIPLEKHSDFLETLEIIKYIKPNGVQVSIFHPYPGTRLYDRIKEMGLINGEGVLTPSERKIAVISYPDFSISEIQDAYLQLNAFNNNPDENCDNDWKKNRFSHKILNRLWKNKFAQIVSHIKKHFTDEE